MTWLGQPQLYSESVCWFNPYIAVYDTTCLFRGEKQSHFTVHYSRVSTTFFFVSSGIKQIALYEARIITVRSVMPWTGLS